MYDLDKKFIFTHPHKCGGTSIEDLVGFLKLRDKFPSVRLFKHASLAAHLNKLADKEITADDFFKFSIIRNPWTRAVSFYNHYKYQQYDFYIKQQSNSPIPEAVKDAQELSFKDFIFKHTIHNFNSEISTKPYMFFHGKFFINYVIRLEHLEEDLYSIKDKLKLDLTSGIPHRNNTDEFTKRISYLQYYDKETKNRIKQAFEWDIKTFNYNFE